MSERHLLLFLFQVLLLLGLARGFGELLRRWGHPPLIGEILIGVALGPTVLGRALPELQSAIFPSDAIQHAMLETVSWFGVLFLLLETGLEVDVSAAWRQRGPALRVGTIGVIVPLALGFVLSLGLPDRYLADPEQRVTFALFLGTTMAISAMVIIARVLHDLDLVKSDLGLVTLCGYAVNDILAWIIFSVVLATAIQDALSVGPVLLLVVFTLSFTGLSVTLGLRLVDRAIAYIGSQRPDNPGAVLSFVCCLGLFCGAVTQWAGLTALLGFFLAGIMAGEARALSERTRQVLSQMVHAIFVPLYFASIGLRVDFLANFDLVLVVFVTAVSIAGKYLGAWLGALGPGLSREDRVSVAIAFTPSGVTGIVVAGVALEHGILSTPVFVAIVFSTLVSSLAVAPWLAWSIRRRREVDVLAFLPRRAIVPALGGTERFGVIRELCEAVAEYAQVPADALFEAVGDRERLMGTGTGHEIAIPHARLPTLPRPVLSFGRSVGGVDWDAPDGRPVRLVFLLLTPEREDGLQLQILAALAQAMTPPEARERLKRADTQQAAWLALADALRAQKLVRVPPPG
jgi:Kef-type K+ transport system membrane component KefB/mannitol/fructose-specific phosphotransferase system IIA component (Ntr-type)